MLNLGVDIDGVLADFARGILRVAGVELDRFCAIEEYDFRPVLNFGEIWPRIKDNKEFWLGLQALETPPLPRCCTMYLTSRACSDEVTRTWLRVHGFPELPIVNTQDKAGALRDFFLDGLVDDHDVQFHAAQVLADHNFLVSRPWNRKVVTPRRICRLDELEWRT